MTSQLETSAYGLLRVMTLHLELNFTQLTDF
jgi:hypothetical protein